MDKLGGPCREAGLSLLRSIVILCEQCLEFKIKQALLTRRRGQGQMLVIGAHIIREGGAEINSSC